MIHEARLSFPEPVGELKLEVHGSFGTAERDWRRFEAYAQGHPFQCFDWLSTWYARIGVGQGVRPFIVMVRAADGQLGMLLPLALESGRYVRRLVGMGSPVCDYHGPLVDAAFARRLSPAVMERLIRAAASAAGADYAFMTHVPPQLGTVKNPMSGLSLRRFSADAHATTLGPDWLAFYASRRTARTRRRFREKEQALSRHGSLAFEPVTDTAQREALIAEVVALKAAQLRATAGPFNGFARTDVQRFFRDLAAASQRERELLAFRLTVDGKLLAAALGLIRNGCFYYEVTVYADDAMQRYSPGALLLHRVMEWAIASGCCRFDFTVGDESYKADWCDQTWELRCGAWPLTARGRVAAGMALSRVALMRRIKRSPRLFAQAVRLRTALGTLRKWTQRLQTLAVLRT